jgi:hypothetical protein
MPTSHHRGVSETDPRNDGPIAFFRPPDVTLAYLRQRLGAVFSHETPEQLDARARRFMADLAERRARPDPPLSQPLEAAADPWFGLGVHPEIISKLWRLNDSLPQSSRWLVWGHPALVHPKAGVIFAVAIGTLGIAARLPSELREGAAVLKFNFRRNYDIRPVGPEWRFLPPGDDATAIRAAYDFAGERV